MRILAYTGATGQIGMALRAVCEQHSSYDGYVCYCRNVQKLPTYDIAANCCIEYDMQKEPLKKELVPPDFLQKADEIDLVLLAYTIEPIRRVGTYEQAELENSLAINVLSQINLINQYAGYAHERHIPLKLIFVDSGAAYQPLTGWSLYCGGKAYVDMYLRCLALESADRIVLFDPGVVDTGMQHTIRESSATVFDRVEEFRDYQKKGILHTPGQVAERIYERYLRSWQAEDIREGFRS